MDMTDYIIDSSRTAIYPYKGTMGGLTYVLLGLGGEAGEVSEIIKKMMRDDNPVDVPRLKSEIGDMLWYWSQIMIETSGKFEPEFDADKLQEEVYTSLNVPVPEFNTPQWIQNQTTFFKHFYICYGQMNKAAMKVDSQEDYTKACQEIAQLNVEVIKIIGCFLTNIGVKVSEAMQGNLDKLSARMAAGKLQGSGETLDER